VPAAPTPAPRRRSVDAFFDVGPVSIDYLNYDRLSKAEVHTHLPDGGRQMQWFIAQQGISPRLHLSSYDEHESRLFALAERLDREAGAL